MNDLLKAVRLTHLEKELPALLEQARIHSLTYDAFLRRVLLTEIEARKHQAQDKRLRAARLPVRKSLEDFDFSFQPTIASRQVWELAELSFIQTSTNVILLGPPGAIPLK
jgi:DNA replication protein DnaC